MGNIWLDLVRYSEYFLKMVPEADIEIVTLFMKYSDKRVTDIYAVTTDRLLGVLRLDVAAAESILRLRDQVPRSLNAQAALAESDVRRIASFHISRGMSL